MKINSRAMMHDSIWFKWAECNSTQKTSGFGAVASNLSARIDELFRRDSLPAIVVSRQQHSGDQSGDWQAGIH
jgi:hypothetical protein